MINQIGTKIYYCNLTGNVIKIIGDMQGYVKETTFDEDYLIYQELNEREKESIGLIQLGYGEYAILSKDSTGVMVDLDTNELIFTYEEIPQPPAEPTWEEVINDKISTLEEENIKLKESQAEQDIMMQSTQDAVDFILLEEMPMKLKNINLGGKSMANYIALRIIQKGEVSEKAGQDYYVTFLTNSKYARFKDEVDIILKASGNENLIVDLTSL